MGGGDVVDVRRRHRRVNRPLSAGVVDHVQLDATGRGREARPTRGVCRQRHRRGIEQICRLGEIASLSAAQAAHHQGKQAAEQSAVAVTVGIRQGGANRRRDAQMIQSARMARHARLDIAQCTRLSELRKQHRHQMALAVEPTCVRIGTQLCHKPVEVIPRKLLRHAMHDAILMSHGIVLLVSWSVGKRPNPSRINVVRFAQQKPCRTAVGQALP